MPSREQLETELIRMKVVAALDANEDVPALKEMQGPKAAIDLVLDGIEENGLGIDDVLQVRPWRDQEAGEMTEHTLERFISILAAEPGNQNVFQTKKQSNAYKQPEQNPWRKPFFNLGAQGLVLQNDPELAEKWKREAEIWNAQWEKEQRKKN